MVFTLSENVKVLIKGGYVQGHMASGLTLFIITMGCIAILVLFRQLEAVRRIFSRYFLRLVKDSSVILLFKLVKLIIFDLFTVKRPDYLRLILDMLNKDLCSIIKAIFIIDTQVTLIATKSFVIT